jgi:membrane protease YdiL (CAAX protease family)
MKTIKAFVKSHSLLSYFALAFTLSWGAVLMVVGPSGFLGTKEIPEVLEPFLYVTMVLGPSVAGILLTSLLYGRAGLREFGSRLLRWRVGARWYAVALLTAPLSMMAVLFTLSLTSPVYLPGIFITDDKTTVLLSGISGGLVAGIFEELGWTEFAIPRMRLRYGVLATGLIVGVLWGAWHFPLFSGSGSSSGALPPALYLVVLLFSVLPAFRVLMVWVYDRTGESLLVAILMHVSLTASTLIFMPLATSGVTAVTYDLVLATSLWILVGAIAVVQRGHLTRQPPHRRRVA